MASLEASSRVAELPRITIAGAGIAGLVAALALLREGFQVELLEQALEMREIGAGLQLGPNATRALLALGLRDELEPVVSEASRKEVRHWQSGRTWPLFDLGEDCIQRFGAPYWMIHRGDFHRVLIAAARRAGAAFRLGARVADVTQTDGSVMVRLAGGETKICEVLIGADGVHSAVRAALGYPDQARFTGIMAWRGLAQAAKLSEAACRPVGVNWVGPGGHVITYPVRDGALINFVGVVEGRDWPVESWTEVGSHEECLADFAAWHPVVRETILALDTPFKWALVGREPMMEWASGRVCLIGDACHPTLPFLAQGANIAIEDGVMLARALADDPGDPQAAFRRLAASRVHRTSAIVRKSRENADRFHNPLLADEAEANAYITREWTPALIRDRYDWLYEYDPLIAPLAAPPQIASV